jgi:formylglycine-generating enzyme
VLEDLLQAVVDDPHAEDRYLVLADWMEENDDPRRGELLRLHRRLLATCTEPERHPERAAWQARVVALLGEGVRPCVPQRIVSLGEGVEMTFAFVPPGTFLMGSPATEPERTDDETQHRVTLTEGFWLAVHAVTQGQWEAVTGRNPSKFKGDTLPVETVSWADCQKFVKRLSQKTGKRLRLPTEGEWEYACRAGTSTPFSFGETISTDQANYDGNYTYGKGKNGVYREKTTPVGSFPANAWGLHMHGNVWEWCSDWFGPYPSGDSKDPQGANSGTVRVLRGGSWAGDPRFCRSAYRGRSVPGSRLDARGCRVLLCLD